MIVEWEKEECPLCKGSGRVWTGHNRGTNKCDHKWSKASLEHRLELHKETMDKVEIEYLFWEEAMKKAKEL